MGTVTTITFIFNASPSTVTFLNVAQDRSSWTLDSGVGQHISWGVPWAGNPNEFNTQHIEVQVSSALTYFIWQSSENDGDWVRQSTDGFHYSGQHMWPSGFTGDARALIIRADSSLYLGATG